jgi:WD40 repeat protein
MPLLLNLIPLITTVILAIQPATTAQDSKKEFIELLKTLPTKREFYTEEAIRKAGPHLPVVLSLTERDIEKHDFYAFAAISSGLGSHKEHRVYVLRHFADIRHPDLKLFWAAILFKANDVSSEVVHYLSDALNETKRAELLAGMVGPDFKFFKRKVRSHPYANRDVDKRTRLVEEEEGHADWVVAVAFFPDGKTLVSGSHDGTLIFWDVATGRQLRSIEDHRQSGRPFEITSVAVSADGKMVASASSDETVRLWDAATGVQLQILSHVKSAHDIVFSPDGGGLAVANCETVMVWNVAGKNLMRTFKKAGTGRGDTYCARHVAFSPDSRELIANGGPIQTWQVSTGRELKRFDPQGSGFGMALSHDGTKLLLGEDFHGYLGMVELWDTVNSKLLRRFPQQARPVESVALSPDGKIAALERCDAEDIDAPGFITLWDANTGEELRKLAGHNRRVAALAFAPDGKTLASGSWDHSIKLWDVTTGKEIRRFPTAK